MEAVLVCFPYRHAAPLEMTVAASAPPVMFIKKGRGSAAGCVEGLHPTGKTAHYILCVAPLLHPLLSLTHWIFRSLMLPYKSSSHSAKCVRCASLLFRGRGERVLCSKKHKKELPKEFSFFILIRMRSSVRCPRCRRDRLHAVHQRRMLWLRSCSKRPVLRSSGVLRLRELPRSERLRYYHIHSPAGR